MSRKLICLIFILLAITNYSQAQNNLVPAKYKSIGEVSGDLDKDGIEEKVVVYNMDLDTAEYVPVDRELIIFKKIKNKWVIWQRSLKAVGDSESGGMMGDPFEDVEIKNGILYVNQSGGSSWKWRTVDKYRFQNNRFELIGHSNFYGKPCEYWKEFDYNVSTGRINVTKEYETCENQEQVISKKEIESFVHKLKNKITLQERDRGEPIEIISPKYKHLLYL